MPTPLQITITPRTTLRTTLPEEPVGAITSFDDLPEDFEASLQRRATEQQEMGDFYSAVGASGADPEDVLQGFAEAGGLSGNRLAEREADRIAARRTWIESLKPVASDIASGLVEAPRQIIGGARDAAQAAINGLGAVGDWLNVNVANLDAMVGLPPAPAKTQMPQLPDVKQAGTTTGGIVRDVAQFLTGFAGAGKLLGAAAGSGVGAAAVKGAMSDLAAFEAHEERLSDLIQKVPALANPVTEYLSRSGDEGELEGRLKRAVEGLGVGMAVEGLILGLRAIKAARAARTTENPTASAQSSAVKVAPEQREVMALDLLGDGAEGAPLVGLRGRRSSGPADDLGVPDDVAAQSLTDRGLTPLGNKEDGVFVNFARINTPVDVKRVISDTADAFKPEIDAARRGTRTNAETIADAAKLDAWDILRNKRQGAALNAEESLAARNLWEASGRKLLEVAEVASRNPSPENLFQFRKMLATHHAIQQEVIAARTETARALQSWRIPAGGPREQLAAIEDMVTKTGGLDVNAVFAARIAALKDIPNGLAALDAVVDKGVFAKSLDAVKEFWIMALLSGPKTHLVNMMSNTAIAGQQVIERALASRFSQILGTGDVPIGEAAAQAFGQMMAIRDAFRYAGKTFMSGESGYGMGKVELPFDRAISAGNFNLPNMSWLGSTVDTMGKIINLPGRALLAEDEFFKTIGYRGELAAQAFRMASREVADGKIAQAGMKSRIADIMANPPENMRISAADAAMYQTFTSPPGETVKAINQLEQAWSRSDASAGSKLAATLLRFTIPFRNTPSNILKYTFERTPLAPLSQRYRDAIAQGGAAADIARARMALGTATILLAADLALDGHLTGSGPDRNERGERDALMRSGWQPYSIKVGDRYFAFNRLDPIGFTLGIGADLAEAMQNTDLSEASSKEIQKAFAAAAFSIGNNVLNKSYMRGMSEFVTAVMEPERQGVRYTERLAGSFMPAGVAEATRFIDPYMRATDDIVSRIRSRTPVLSQDLPLLRDLWGRERPMRSGLGAAYDAISPVYSRREDVQPIDREMFEHGFYLLPPKKVSDDLAMQSRFMQLQGQAKPSELGDRKLMERYGDSNLLDTLNAVVTGTHKLSNDYRNLEETSEKRRFIMRIVSAYRKAARARVAEEFKAGAESDPEE